MSRHAFDESSKCTFCGKRPDQVQKVVAGPGVRICDECVDLVNEILEESLPAWPWTKTVEEEPTPSLGAEAALARLRSRYGRPLSIPPGIDEELDRMWVEFRKDPTGPARDRLFEHYQSLLPDTLDLTRVHRAVAAAARSGLLQALASYRVWHSESFEDYAMPFIYAAIAARFDHEMFIHMRK